MQNVLRLKYISDHFPNKVFNSQYFNIFNKKVTVGLHPMDKDLEGYRKVVEEIITPDCMEISRDVKEYPQRIKKYIKYAHPGYDFVQFTPELTYRLLTPPEQQTPEKLKHVHIIRALCDIVFTMVTTIDDIADNAPLRENKKPWYMICEGGMGSAILDGLAYSYIIFYILKKHFKSNPGYVYMMEKFTEVLARSSIGQSADIYSNGKLLSFADYYTIASLKGGMWNSQQTPTTMAYMGILDEKLLEQTCELFLKLGYLGQVWDDFCDYFYNLSEFGEEATDIPNGTNNWASVTANQYFDSKQKQIFKECYGRADPEKIEQIRKLYYEIDVPRLYIEYLRNFYKQLCLQIEELPDDRVKKVAYSWMDFLIGDVNDANYHNIYYEKM